MAQTFRKLLALAVCVNLAGCTTMRAVPDWQVSAAASPLSGTPGLKSGDPITVTTSDGRKAELVFKSLTADHLEGSAGPNNIIVQIPRSQILGVERPEVGALKTAGLVATVLLGTLFVIGVSNMAVMPGPFP
jgi:hypothetical protein